MITAQIEAMADVFAEMQPLFADHYSDLSLHQGRHALDPNYAHYRRREEMGELLLATLRHNGGMIGYYVGFVAYGLHYQTCLTLSPDIFFIHPAHRGGSGALRLFRCVEREARRRGVHLWFAGTKLHKDSSRLFVALGMVPVESTYAKWLR